MQLLWSKGVCNIVKAWWNTENAVENWIMLTSWVFFCHVLFKDRWVGHCQWCKCEKESVDHIFNRRSTRASQSTYIANECEFKERHRLLFSDKRLIVLFWLLVYVSRNKKNNNNKLKGKICSCLSLPVKLTKSQLTQRQGMLLLFPAHKIDQMSATSKTKNALAFPCP